MINLPDVMKFRQGVQDSNNAAQVNTAKAQAAGQAQSAWNQATGNVLSDLWTQPANFGSIMSNIYGTQAGNTGQQGANYTNAYGNLVSGLGNAANMYGGMFNANAMAEAARQTALGNMGSSALGAYGGAMNSAMTAYGLQQQAYNMALANAMQGNQSALASLGASRNNALGNIGSTYGALGNAAAQLGGLGLTASQFSQTDSMQDQFARNRQRTGGYSDDYANMYGGGGGAGGGSQGMIATGPEGQIASGSYSPGYGGGGYDMGGFRRGSSNTFGESDSEARNTTRSSQTSGPQMDAFRASLGAGMGGIGGALGGLADTRGSVMDNSYVNALQGSYGAGMNQLREGNLMASQVPGQMLDQGLSGLLALGRQGYGQVRQGMNQYYDNARRSQAVPDAMVGMLGGGYANTVGNLDNVRGDINRGAATARGDVQNLYDGSVGNWMGGNFYTGPGRMSGLIPEFRHQDYQDPRRNPRPAPTSPTMAYSGQPFSQTARDHWVNQIMSGAMNR